MIELRRHGDCKSRLMNKWYKMIVISLLLLLVFLVGCLIGPSRLSIQEVFLALFHQGSEESRLILWHFRLPRLCLAFFTGLAMGASGVIMQSLLHNDLASPGTLGVSSGSSLAVTLYMTLLASETSEPFLLPLFALIGGIGSTFLIALLASKRRKPLSPTKLIMTGVAVSAAYGAVATFVTYVLDETKLQALQRWQAGELWAAEEPNPWTYILMMSLWVMVFLAFAIGKARVLNAVNLGYETAAGIGVNVKTEFYLLAFIAVALSSSGVAFGGNFFFLGLIGPHIAKQMLGSDNRFLLPASGILAAIIILTANILVTDTALFSNIPTGIIISVVSVPYFIYLLLRKGEKNVH